LPPSCMWGSPSSGRWGQRSLEGCLLTCPCGTGAAAQQEKQSRKQQQLIVNRGATHTCAESITDLEGCLFTHHRGRGGAAQQEKQSRKQQQVTVNRGATREQRASQTWRAAC
jgi:hypothetical protein